MDELAELQAQHQRGHGPCGCLQPDRCPAARYLVIIERQAGELAEARAELAALKPKYVAPQDNPNLEPIPGKPGGYTSKLYRAYLEALQEAARLTREARR